MTTISNVGMPSASNADSSSSSRQGSSRLSASLGQILKTAGVLALALSGGAQARPLDSFSHSRHLNQEGAHSDSHSPYGYKTLCDSGIIDHYAKGMSYEDCLLEENTAINEVKDGKPLALLKRCYTGSGSLSAALTGVSLASLIGGTSAGIATSVTSISLASVALLPTAICGGIYATINGRIRDSRAEAKECCKHFPTQSVVQANEAKVAANNTAKVIVPEASNASQALAPAVTAHPVASITSGEIFNSSSTQQEKTFSNSTTITTVTTMTNTTVRHQSRP